MTDRTRFTVTTPIVKNCIQENSKWAIDQVEAIQNKHCDALTYLTATDGHQLVVKPVVGTVKGGGACLVPRAIMPTSCKRTDVIVVDEGEQWANSKDKTAEHVEGNFPPGQDVCPKVNDDDYTLVTFNAELLAKIQSAMGSKGVAILVRKDGKNKAIPVMPTETTRGEDGAFGVLMAVSFDGERTAAKYNGLVKRYAESRVEAYNAKLAEITV